MKKVLTAFAALSLMACNSTNTSSDTSGTGGFSTNTTATGSGLVNCATNIDAEVPAFYHSYFRCVDITMSGGDVVIWTDGVPPHQSSYYENGALSVAWDDQGGTHQQNPNWIATQDIAMTIATNPIAKGIVIDQSLVDVSAQTSDEEYGGGPIGVALNGVSVFNAAAAPGDDLDDEQWTFDLYDGHPQLTGTYHYHAQSAGPLEVLFDGGFITDTTPGSAEIELYGMLCDGTLVLGCTELDGSAPSDVDFDAQNGHLHDISDGSTTHFANRYHTHVCPGAYPAHPYNPEIAYYETTGCPAAGPGAP